MTEPRRVLPAAQPRDGRRLPDGVSGHATPTAATVPGQHSMIVDYVGVWQSGGDDGGDDGGSTPGPNPGTGFDARSIIQAEDYSAQSGTFTEATTDEGGGRNVAGIANGDWLRYDNVDFGSTPVTQFKARVASGAPAGVSGLVQVRLGSPTATPIGDFAIANTGGWAELAHGPGEHRPDHREAHRLHHLLQRPARGLRQPQLVHLLDQLAAPARPGPPGTRPRHLLSVPPRPTPGPAGRRPAGPAVPDPGGRRSRGVGAAATAPPRAW